ncbi:MAG: pyruvate, water dikinase [Patescibacteria group bacterium]|nr:pyruvate, water dikinase [Patescibacteria group bacterium]
MPNSNNSESLILPFSQLGKGDIPIAGGKGANLGEMFNNGIPVPDGFVVTSNAYYRFIKENGLMEMIKKKLTDIDIENSKLLQSTAQEIQKIIKETAMSEATIQEIKSAYHFLCGNSDKQVAVRSSATAEDLPDASFAGQQETYLNIIGWQNVARATQNCWASLFGARAIYYRSRQGFDHFKVGIAVPIQLMIQSEVSGIMFTVNPLTNNKDEISVEAAYGLGETVVSGTITPDQYILEKKGLNIKKKHIVKQTWQLTKQGRVAISRDYQDVQKLEDKLVTELATIGLKLEQHYKHPQDIEWGMYKNKIYIVQTRPITTLTKNADAAEEQNLKVNIPQKDILLDGNPASPGYATGKVRIIHSASEINLVQQGEILVTEMTNPDFVPAMRKAGAIVTDEGGATSHAAIVSRELGIPAIVGTELATKMLKTGDQVTVNGYQGKVYAGDYLAELKALEPEKDYSEYKTAKTATKVYVNLGEPELAPKVAAMGVDGVGLLRAEFMMAEIGKHPRQFIEEGKQEEFINKLVEGLTVFAKAFNPRPIIYRANDFKTNEYRALKGGDKFEQEEQNPLIGYRGVSRYLDNEEVFAMEIEAIKRVRNKLGYKNLQLMLPFVRTVEQFIKCKKILSAHGLTRKGSFELYMMVEIPSNVIMLDEFIDAGLDGLSIGSNDLTMLILGLDRDNPKIADVYDERNPAVLWALEKIITTAKRRGVKVSICGQAPTRYPELTRKLVEWGTTSVSVSPDVAYLTRKIVAESELALVRKKK